MSRYTTEPFPTQGGSYTAWLPEYEGRDGWRQVPMVHGPDGIPGDRITGGISATIGLCNYAQAMSLAWSYAAVSEHETGKRLKVRVVEHCVEYDIKCYRQFDVEGVATDGGGKSE